MPLPNPTKKRRYPFKRQLKRKVRRIIFMLVAAAIASGISYYNKQSNQDNQKRDHALKESTRIDTSEFLNPSGYYGTDPKTVHKIEKAKNNPNSQFWVVVGGKVTKLLKDDLSGSRHQKFLIKLGGTSSKQNLSLLIVHNIDLAPRVPVKKGDSINISGLYEWNNRGGLIHWTHHDPKGKKKGGWIRLNNKDYR